MISAFNNSASNLTLVYVISAFAISPFRIATMGQVGQILGFFFRSIPRFLGGFFWMAIWDGGLLVLGNAIPMNSRGIALQCFNVRAGNQSKLR